MEQLPSADLLLFTRYYHAKKITIEMAIDRGFEVDSDKNILKMSLEDFIEDSIKRNGLYTVVRQSLNREYKNSKGGILLIKFEEPSESTQQGVGFAMDFIKLMSETKGKTRFGIAVVEQPLSHDAKQKLNMKYDFRLQVFQLSDLQYNPTRHMFAANKYTAMTPKEQKAFLTREKIKPKQLSQISFEDPITRYFGWQIGQIIKKNITALTSETLTDEFVEFSIIDGTPL